ncbi:hypothetical protein GCM10011400_63760 [Paraburkholderia caffeinilytica]|uniref:Lipoprotein n=1 Tax=Paraburkholderia caffeinilytica TaxID=1761016 RepID=A0ABQ1NB63_9BURK|nr:hypothetical protein GCM10011400_63760 [Paraburkholderia caffeinilytica]CAB3804093.1 hypothetical protein LMG28690_05933 [Paraburkholderia caffeinilytica]
MAVVPGCLANGGSTVSTLSTQASSAPSAASAAALVECDSRGVTSSDYGLFKFEHLKRPVFPLDAQTEWVSAN